MASYRNIVLIALFFLIGTTPRAHGVVIGGDSEISILGPVSCAVPGTLPILSSPRLGGVSVNITCDGGTLTLGQAVTNTAGYLNATFKITEHFLFDGSTCMGTIDPLSIKSCGVLPPNGLLHLTLVLLSIVDGVIQFITGPILT